MAISRIFLWLGFAFMIYAVLMVLTALCGFLLGETTAAQIFLGLAAGLGILGAIIFMTSQNAPRREQSKDALIFLLLFWLIVPLATSVPYMALDVVTGPVQAVFESVSAITTTGASVIIPEQAPKTLLVWRSALQWSGGCFVATFAVVILAAVNLSGTGVHRSVFFTLKSGELFSRLLDIGRIVTCIYAGISALCFFFLLLAGTGIFEALCLSLSAVATGGLTPHSGPMQAYLSNMGGIVLALTCLLGAANISLIWDFIRRRNVGAFLEAVRSAEHRGTFAIIIVLTVAGFLYTGYPHIFTVALEAVYMATSAGYDYHVIGIDMVRPSILIAIALIGGSALSTAGGIKIIRWLLLLRHMRTDLDRMSHPSRVRPVRFQGKIIEDRAFLSIWMYFLAYTMVFAAGILGLGAAGLVFPHAVAASASALSNMGPLMDATYPEISYRDMNNTGLTILTVVMLLGRVEVLAAFAALTPSFWRA